MKTTYQQPLLAITALASSTIIATSITPHGASRSLHFSQDAQAEDNEEARAKTGQANYDAWDDDWSK